MLNILKPKILFLSLTIFLCFFKIEAQNFTNQGEGKVVVEKFLSFDKSPDLSIPYQTYTFYIKNYKVLREEPKIIVPLHEQLNLDSIGHSTTIYDENGNEVIVSSNMVADVRKTKYLLDLKSKTVFVFGHKNSKTYYYKTEMKDFGEDIYNFFSVASDYEKIEFTKKSKQIAENLCEEGLFLPLTLEKNKVDKNFLWATRNKTSIKTPLDNMFNDASPFSIFSASYHTVKVNGDPACYLTFVVKERKEEKFPDELFEIPSDAILLTKAEWESYQF